MPSNRKRTRRPSQAEPWKIEYLLTGRVKRADGSDSCKPYLFGGYDCAPDWKELRDELLPRWIREHPGTRPFAWWSFDAPGPREGDSELDYLRRHNLLTPGERQNLAGLCDEPGK